MTPDRDLAKALALGDLPAAIEALDIMVRDGVVPDDHQVDLGRSDAATILRRRNATPALRAAA